MPLQSSANPLTGMLPILVIWVAIFYVLVFRPQGKARKEREAMLKDLKKHDEVVTTGGMFGTVMNVEAETVTLRVDDNVRIKVEKSAVARLVKAKPAEAA